MATSIFSLFGEVFIDNDKANKAIDDTTKKGEGLGSKLGKGFAAVGKGAAILGGAAVAAGTALTGVALKTADTASTINDMSQRLGMSKTEYQEWDYVLKQNGVSIESMSTGMKTLTKNVSEMAAGSGKGAELLGKLGITLEDTKNLSQQEIFKKTVMALQEMPAGFEKARLAQQLFGKQGQEMLPMLNDTKGSVQGLMDKAHEMGMIMSDEAVTAGDNLGDTIDTLKGAAEGLFNQLGTALIPIVQQMATAILALMPTLQPIIDQMMPILANLLQTIAPVLLQLIQTLLPPLLDMALALMPLFQMIVEQVLPPILDLITQLLPYIVQIVEQLVPVLVELLNTLLPIIMPIIEAILPPLLQLLDAIITPLMKLLNVIMPPLTAVIRTLGGALRDNLTQAFKGLQPIIEAVKTHFTLLIDFVKNVFTGNWSAAWQNVKDIFANAFNGLKAVAKAPVNYVIRAINTMIRGLNGLKIPDWVPGLGGKSINLREIPLLAKGGIVSRAGSAIVGDAGPEVLNLPRGAEVRPLDKVGGGVTLQFNAPVTIVGNNGMQQFVRMIAEQLSLNEARYSRAGGIA